MDRLNTETQSAEAASTAWGATLIIQVCRLTDTPPNVRPQMISSAIVLQSCLLWEHLQRQATRCRSTELRRAQLIALGLGLS
jgi:hypothetical protein